MTFLYRCNNTINGGRCGKRQSLKHLHTWYLVPPKCNVCGEPLTYRDVWQEKKNKDKNNLCFCDALPFIPHRAGSNVMCDGYEGEPTQEQINEYHEHQRG